MDDFKFVRCPNCGWEKNPRKPCFNCGDKKPPAPSKTSNGTELATAQERIAELEKALEPFAREASEWNKAAQYNGGITDSTRPSISGCHSEPSVYAEFTVGDLRRAADLLKEDKK